MSSEAYQRNLACRETGGSDMTVWLVELALKYVLEEALEAVREWFPEEAR